MFQIYVLDVLLCFWAGKEEEPKAKKGDAVYSEIEEVCAFVFPRRGGGVGRAFLRGGRGHYSFRAEIPTMHIGWTNRFSSRAWITHLVVVLANQ